MTINILILTTLLLIFTTQISDDNQEQVIGYNGFQSDQLNSSFVQQEEQEMRQTERDQMSNWIAQEMDIFDQDDQSLQYGQYFILQLQADQSQEFRYPLKIPGKQYKIQFIIYTSESGDDFTYMKDPREDQFIEVEQKKRMDHTYQKLGTVYINNKFKVKGEDGIFIRLNNLHGRQVLVQIGLQGDQITINPDILTKDDHFALQAQKISVIHQQSKKSQANRYRYYKTEWGFHQRQEHYESQMLTLTGFQLFVILVTSIVQMYCIKGLMDNHQVI